jgi:predicted membrane-bound spermidine synthase
MLVAGLTALVCGLVFVLEVAPGLGLMPQTHQSYGWAFVIAATVAILLAVRYVERLDDWRVAHQEWLDEWVCMACGAVEARP